MSLDGPSTPTASDSSAAPSAAAAATSSSVSSTDTSSTVNDKPVVVVAAPAQRDLKTDIIRGVVLIAVLLYLLLNHLKWNAVNRNVTQLESKIDALSSLVNELMKLQANKSG